MSDNMLTFRRAAEGAYDFPRILVLLPTHDMVPATFMYAMQSLSAYTVSQLPPSPAEYGVTMVKGTYVHSARQDLLERALKRDFTHVLWLDTDMRFPRESLMRLLAHNLPVVGINYCQRGAPYEFTAIKKSLWACELHEKGEKLLTLEESRGLEEVDAVGFGMVLMEVATLKRVLPDPRLKPWFWFEWFPERNQQMGEDVAFCRHLRQAGVRIFVDHDLSKECSHVGQYDYDCHDAEVNLRQPAKVAGD